MAGNENVIDSLRLEIGVNIRGQDRLSRFQETLTSFAATLNRVNTALASYIRMADAAGSIRIPTMQAPSGPAPVVPQTETERAVAPNVNTDDIRRQQDLFAGLTQSIDSASKAMNRFNDRVSKVSKGASKANDALKDVSDTAGQIGESFSKATKGLGGIIKSFARIAKYRMIRAILKGIVEGFKEGVQNLARFDSQFNSTMSAFVTSTQYLKNALGTLARPLLELVIPALVKVIDVIVEAINKLNAFIAAVKGEDTYVAAKKVAVDYAESLDKANKKAKELKNTLLGFDEINRLNDNSSASGSGVDASEMFENRKVASSLSQDTLDFATNLKMTINDVLFDWSDLTPEQIAEKCVAGSSTLLGAIVGGALGGPVGAIVGAAIGLGLGLLLDNFIFNHDGKLSRDEVVKAILGTTTTLFATILGGALFGPVGAVIGATIGMALSFAIAIDPNQTAALNSLLDGFKTLADGLVGLFEGIGSGFKDWTNNLKDVKDRLKDFVEFLIKLSQGDLKGAAESLGASLGGGMSKGTEDKWREFKDV